MKNSVTAERLETPSGSRPGSEKEPALATAAWLASFHGCPWTDNAATARLPANYESSDKPNLVRLLAAAGLKARLVLRKPKEIDPAVLPAVVFSRSGKPIILVEFLDGQTKARILEPGNEASESEIKLSDLKRRITNEVMLVTVDDEGAERRLSADRSNDRGHWFWRPMRENWGEWGQVFFAALCINLLGLSLPIFVMNVYDKVVPNLAFVTLWTLALGVSIALILDWALRTVRAGIVERVGRRLDNRISAGLFQHAMALRPEDFSVGSIGVASHIRDFETVREFFGSASLLSLIDLVFIGLFFVVLYFIVGPLAYVPMIAVPVMLVLALAAQVPLGRATRDTQSLSRRKNTVLIETLSGLDTVKSLNAEPEMQREWNRSSAIAARIGGRGRFWSNFTANGTMAIQQFVSVGIVVWGVFLIAEGSITVGALIAANILASRALAPLGNIAQTIFRAQFAWSALKSLSTFMALQPERDQKIHSNFRVSKGAVQLSDVTYTYPNKEVPAVRDFSLTIKPGETIALLGRVGSGKSTLGKLLSGLLVPQRGTILIDGHSLGQYDPSELRSGVGYLPQDTELFTGTLRENLLIGCRSAPPDEIDRALHLAGADEFISTLPKGLDQFIGERGSHLSGGQRQGLALARLLLRRPKIVFLDEPTNAMDRDMETLVAQRLRELPDNETSLILCTHRPALANLAHRMIVMDSGRKVLDGPRDDVMSKLNAVGIKKQAGEH
ncbi:Toxin RTX-I translocation ATP-binding protein [Roseovarius gaetbuli]|uniref:Toxin RTX-I translocation ATP-binding protein n=1 Tax=Roseovarius gaetbuli TaxID=1356575 RepID=A0A1X7ABE8_9RHOB|nr:Toxin RTX-I translocation ATP-binding protein [Roseovarius gaetbuli]